MKKYTTFTPLGILNLVIVNLIWIYAVAPNWGMYTLEITAFMAMVNLGLVLQLSYSYNILGDQITFKERFIKQKKIPINGILKIYRTTNLGEQITFKLEFTNVNGEIDSFVIHPGYAKEAIKNLFLYFLSVNKNIEVDEHVTLFLEDKRKEVEQIKKTWQSVLINPTQRIYATLILLTLIGIAFIVIKSPN